MDWYGRSAWLDEDRSLTADDYTLFAKHHVTTLYTNPNFTSAPAVVKDLVAHGLNAGIYECSAPQWEGRYANLTAAQFAAVVHADVKRLIPQSYPLPSQARGAPVMLDLEANTVQFQHDVLVACRSLMPSRELAYTNEPFKNGTVVPIPTLIAQGYHWYPQLYHGDMSPADAAAVVLEVTRAPWHFPADRLHPFYNAAALPSDSRDGCFFTADKLPA